MRWADRAWPICDSIRPAILGSRSLKAAQLVRQTTSKVRRPHSATPVTSLKLGPGLRAHFGIQESGVAGVQELENLGACRGFSQGDAGPGFSDKDLALVFWHSCNYSLYLELAAAQKFLLKSSRALARGVLLTPEFCFLLLASGLSSSANS